MKITNITPRSCSALTIIDGINHRKAYINSAEGRVECFAECADAENFDELLAAWGDAPTVEPEPIPEYTPTGPTLEERLTALEQANDELTIAILEG